MMQLDDCLRGVHRIALDTPPLKRHMGSAITSGCQLILTNDADFKRITEVRVVLLSEVSV